nr:unnamed protein product [Callosobruchus analis]
MYQLFGIMTFCYF